MSALDDLIQEIADENLRRRIEKEVTALKGTKKFGLVFEPQNPESLRFTTCPSKRNLSLCSKLARSTNFIAS